MTRLCSSNQGFNISLDHTKTNIWGKGIVHLFMYYAGFAFIA